MLSLEGRIYKLTTLRGTYSTRWSKNHSPHRNVNTLIKYRVPQKVSHYKVIKKSYIKAYKACQRKYIYSSN